MRNGLKMPGFNAEHERLMRNRALFELPAPEFGSNRLKRWSSGSDGQEDFKNIYFYGAKPCFEKPVFSTSLYRGFNA